MENTTHNEIDKAFTTNLGIITAKRLVAIINNTEQFSNWDECLASILAELGKLANSRFKLPADNLIYAEIINKAQDKMKHSRYSISVNE